MSTWVWVTPIEHRDQPPMAVNLDLVAIIKPIGAIGNHSLLVWHGSSPRIEWRVAESPEAILTQPRHTPRSS